MLARFAALLVLTVRLVAADTSPGVWRLACYGGGSSTSGIHLHPLGPAVEIRPD